MLNIIKHYKFWFAVSGVLTIIAIASLAIFGLRFGVDFKGGTVTQLEYQETPDISKIRDVVEKKIPGSQVQSAGTSGVNIKTSPLEKEQYDQLIENLKKETGQFTEKSFTSIGPIIGKELRVKAIYQLILVSLGIVFYIAYAFRKVTRPITSWKFGWAAIVALLHDLLLVIGLFSVLGHFFKTEIDSLFITALLTVLGFSVHDTIVVFDRIRENLRTHAGQPIEYIVNNSINQTIVRSINTSFTVLFVLLALFLFGGETIKYFVLALLVGVVAGTYSSIFIASPILVLWQKWQTKRV